MRMFLVRLLAGKMPVALNLKVNGEIVVDRPGVFACNVIGTVR